MKITILTDENNNIIRTADEAGNIGWDLTVYEVSDADYEDYYSGKKTAKLVDGNVVFEDIETTDKKIRKNR
jgi:hypothetical protein